MIHCHVPTECNIKLLNCKLWLMVVYLYQVWLIRVCVYFHQPTGAHFIASRDLGCIQKHSGSCESPTAFNIVQVRSTDCMEIWRRGTSEEDMRMMRNLEPVWPIRDDSVCEPRGVELKGSCSFQLRKEAEQRQVVRPRLNVESNALNLWPLNFNYSHPLCLWS